jgi:hypothetical protein
MLNPPSSPFIATPYTATSSPTQSDVTNEIAALVSHYLTNLHRYDSNYERREHIRYAFPAVMALTPVDAVSLEPLAEPTLVTGKQISHSGLGFFHSGPLLHRCFLVSIVNESGDHRDSQFVLRTGWCRFLGKGLYESGGQFIRIVPNRSAPRSE